MLTLFRPLCPLTLFAAEDNNTPCPPSTATSAGSQSLIASYVAVAQLRPLRLELLEGARSRVRNAPAEQRVHALAASVLRTISRLLCCAAEPRSDLVAVAWRSRPTFLPGEANERCSTIRREMVCKVAAAALPLLVFHFQ